MMEYVSDVRQAALRSTRLQETWNPVQVTKGLSGGIVQKCSRLQCPAGRNVTGQKNQVRGA